MGSVGVDAQAGLRHAPPPPPPPTVLKTFLKVYFYLTYVFVHMCVYTPHACSVLGGQKGGSDLLELRVVSNAVSAWGLEPNLSPLQEQQVLIAPPGPSLRPLIYF